MGKNIAVVLITLMMVAGLTACGDGKQSVSDNKGNMLVYEKYEVSENGFYVRNKKNDTYTPVMTQFEEGGQSQTLDFGEGIDISGFDAINTEGQSGQIPHLWLGQKNYDPAKLIPTVDNRHTELVMYYDGTEDMPEEFTLSRYKKLGYTVGLHVTFGETSNHLFFDSKDYCTTSEVEPVLSNLSEGLNRIGRINKSKKLPLKNVDTDVNMLLGLEKNKEYKFGFYDGTTYHKESLIADTLAFKMMDMQILESPYKLTEEDYFIINLPENLKNGYYYINGVGLFKYKGNPGE